MPQDSLPVLKARHEPCRLTLSCEEEVERRATDLSSLRTHREHESTLNVFTAEIIVNTDFVASWMTPRCCTPAMDEPEGNDCLT